jgi:hypothetical protein
MHSRFFRAETLTGMHSCTDGFIKTAPSPADVNFNYAESGKKVPEKVFA